MIAQTTVVGIDVSRDWLEGFVLPEGQRFRFANTASGHENLIALIRRVTGSVKIGFEATGGQEWALWTRLDAVGIKAGQLPPAQIKAFALSHGTRAKTDRIDAELIARFMMFRPDAGRQLPTKKLRILRALTTKRAQIVEMRKRLSGQIRARQKQGVSADMDDMDAALKTMLDAQIAELECRIETAIAQEQTHALKAALLRSVPGIGPVATAMLIAEMPELGRMTSAQAAAMTGLAPVPRDSGILKGRRAIAGGRQSLRRVLFQAALTAAHHNPSLKSVAQRLKKQGKPHKVVIVAIARRLVTIANAILKSTKPWLTKPAA